MLKSDDMIESEAYMNVSIFNGTCAKYYGIEIGIHPETKATYL